MTELPRRKLSEVLFIYEQHPERMDVYVEGPFDASIVRWILQELDLKSVVVYNISSIEVPKADVLASRPRDNNRERLVVLSNIIEKSEALYSVCIVDSDFSLHSGDINCSETLLLTDFPCMEGYLVDASSFEKFVILSCNRPNWSVERIISNLLRVSRTLFYFRFTNELLGWDMAWPNKVSCLSVREWNIEFDALEFRKRWLSSNNMLGKIDEFDWKYNELIKEHKGSVDMEFNGHDFFWVLSWALRNSGISSPIADAESIRRAFTMALDVPRVLKFDLFSLISKRFIVN